MIDGERRARLAIWLKTLAVLIGYVLLTWAIHRGFMSKRVPDPELSLGLAFALQQAVAILILLLISFAVKLSRLRRMRRSARLHPLLCDLLTRHLAGSDQTAALRRQRRKHPRETEECLTEILSAIQGGETARLTALAESFGLVRRWKRQAKSPGAKRRRKAVSRLGLLNGAAVRAELLHALDDPDDLVKVEAARALMRTGERDVVAEVFYMALDQNLLVRVILTEALCPFGRDLCQSALPRALHSIHTKQVVSALEMLRAWGKSAELPGIEGLLTHADPGVRAAALRLVPQAGLTPAVEHQVYVALEDPAPAVRVAAADVCGRMKLSPALPALQHALAAAQPDVVLAAAHALAELGGAGWRILESEVVAGNPIPAAAALEALEYVKLNRLAMVGM